MGHSKSTPSSQFMLYNLSSSYFQIFFFYFPKEIYFVRLTPKSVVFATIGLYIRLYSSMKTANNKPRQVMDCQVDLERKDLQLRDSSSLKVSEVMSQTIRVHQLVSTGIGTV